jgi:hypothetical protein
VADLDDAPSKTTASMQLAAARILLLPSTSPPKPSVEIPAAGHITGKTPMRCLCKRFQKPVTWYSFISAGAGLSSHFSAVNLVFR